ncbi:adenylate cyclase [Rhizomicrobium palustre]|uniref:Adenylate cyclase n=1 Tax=Rhizomicrobium palustre TaxID=189966 RepID=A0A846MZ36_9PROT|nr:adenylate/guanylate cyclase domain-containing protein [Rhizomicrobium palustre]NIK88220.1 adenylate cyclase [Rhizomicrobium palustre]
MLFRDRRLAVWVSPLVTLLLTLIILGADVGDMASRLRGSLFDSFMRLSPRLYEDTAVKGHPVRVLDVDPAAAGQFGAWPWPHAALAGVVDSLKRHGASVVVLVGRVDRPDPLSPRNLLAMVPPGPNYDPARQALSQLPSPDTALVTALSGVKSVTGLALGGSVTPVKVKAEIGWAGGRSAVLSLKDQLGAEGSLPEIETASAGLGGLKLIADPDGQVRRMPLVFRANGKAVPSLEAEVLRLIEDKPQLMLKADDGDSGLFGGAPGVMALETAGATLPTAADGSIWLRYSGANAARMLSASALLADRLPPDAVKDAIVYIGDPTETVTTPGGPRKVAEVHAEALENLLLGTVSRRPAAAAQGELAVLLLLGLGLIFVIGRLGVTAGAGVLVVLTAATGYGAYRIYASEHVLFDALGMNLALWLVWISAAAARGFEMWRTKRALKRAFTDVLPKRVINIIARQPEPMKMEGETRTVTYLSCGVRGFSELASSFRGDPAAFTKLIQRVLDPLMAQALEHEGAIAKLTPDGFAAFWNAPLDDPEHAVHACEAAMGMMEAIAQTNEIIIHERRIDGVALDPVEIGVGISSGPAIAGGFDVHGRKVYSVNGDCAVMASRIQALSSSYGPAVIVSEETRKLAERGFAFLEVDYIALEYQEDPVKLYAMLGNPVMRASPKFRALATFHDHIFQSLRDQQWHKARELIAQCRKLSGASQKLYDLHLSRIAYFKEHPPGPDWDGAFRQILQ